METLTLVLAAAALLVAFAALARAAGATRSAQEVEAEVRRRTENASERVSATLELLTRQVAQLAGGTTLTPEMVLEGRLWRDVGALEARTLLDAGEARVLDVRTPGEAANGVLPGARLIPIDELPERLGELDRDGSPTLVYCAMGGRSAYACDLLTQHGFENLMNLEGGFGSWNGPVERPGAA